MKSSAASADVLELPVLKVLARARAEGRMPHAVLLTGNDGAVLARAAEQLAAMHLGEADPLAHSDCRVLRPAKKSRRIVIENTLEVVAALRLSSLTPRRVVITGLGLISPLGNTAESFWDALIAKSMPCL